MVWELWMAGHPIEVIAARVDCAWATAKKDIKEVQEAVEERDALRAGDAREQAVQDRRHLKSLALSDRAEAAPKDRAPLLKEARGNQDGIEKLQGLDPDEPQAPQANVYLFPLSDGARPQLGELSDDELAEAAAKIKAEQAALPEPAAEEPPAEYTPVEEPAETPDEPPPESAS